MDKKQIQEIVESIEIIIDTREQKNSWITDYFDKRGIKYFGKKLNFGDYSFQCKINDEIVSFEKEISIERKANLIELSNNFTVKRPQFVKEMERKGDAIMLLLIENNTFKDLLMGKYRSEFHPKSFLASLLSFKYRYNLFIEFLRDKECSGSFIYHNFKYYLQEYLKNML